MDHSIYPCSYNETSILIESMLSERSYSSTLANVLFVKAKFDPSRLFKVWGELCSEHPILGSRYEWGSEGSGYFVRRYVKPHFKLIERHNFGLLSVMREIRLQIKNKIEIGSEAIFQLYVYSIDENRNIILIKSHHAGSDDICQVELIKTIIYRYLIASFFPEIFYKRFKSFRGSTDQYSNYTAWQVNYAKSSRGERAKKFWLEEIGKQSSVNVEPTACLGGSNSAHARYDLTAVQRKSLDILTKKHKATRFEVALAIFMSVSYQMNEQKNGLISVIFSTRPFRDGYKKTFGCFSNRVLINTNIDNICSEKDALISNIALARQAKNHRYYPYALVKNKCNGLPFKFNYIKGGLMGKIKNWILSGKTLSVFGLSLRYFNFEKMLDTEGIVVNVNDNGDSMYIDAVFDGKKYNKIYVDSLVKRFLLKMSVASDC